MIKDVYKKSIVWNAIAGIINAGEAVVILAVVSRVNDLRDAGIMALAFSVANLLMTVGKFGVRNYQVAHDGEDFSFRTFLILRIVTVVLMVLVALGYVIYHYCGSIYTRDKAIAIFIVCLWYATEAFEDVFAGKYQAMGRLDVGCKIFSFRWICTIATFVVIDLIYRNIVLASVAACVVGLLVGVALLKYAYYVSDNMWESKRDKGVKELFNESTALCVSSFLYFYMTNIPKYSIDSFLGDETQAIYGYISMPVFVISLLTSFIYQPQLTQYIVEWRERKIKLFAKRIVRQMVIIFLLTVICMIGAYLLGIPVLSALYKENLSMYKIHLLILLLGGGFLAMGGYLSNMLIIMDQQKNNMIGYIIVSVTGYFIINKMVKKFQLLGAVWGYTLTILFSVIVFGGIFVWVLWKNEGNRRA